MFLKEIELTNFKCHTSLKLDFSTGNDSSPTRKTTFLLGENGTGKSAVLKAIALVLAGSNALSDVLGNPDNWIQNKKKFAKVRAVIVTAEGEEREVSLLLKRGHHIKEIIIDNAESLDRLDAAIKHADRNYFVLAYGASRRLNKGGGRRFEKTSFISSPRTNGIKSLFDPDSTLISLAEWAMDIDYSSQGTGLNIVKNALNQFMVENVKFKKIDKKKGQLLFSTPDGEIPLDQLSDGYQNVAAWVGDLMYNVVNSFSDYKNPLTARGLLLIDEIDLHLHPKWQRQLHTFLEKKLPNFQVIVTTHSPLTAQQAREHELYALSREGKKVEKIPFVGDPSKMLLHQILLSPVFGLETDESMEVEKKKTRVRQLTTKKTISKKERAEVEALSKQVAELPMNIRRNSTMEKKDIALLKEINKQLKAKKK